MLGIVSKLVDKVKEQAPKKKQPWELMVIPFKKEPPRYVSKEDRLLFKLLSTPSDPDSITYEVKTYAFDDGLPEEWLEHVKTYRKIIAGQDITTGAPAFAFPMGSRPLPRGLCPASRVPRVPPGSFA